MAGETSAIFVEEPILEAIESESHHEEDGPETEERLWLRDVAVPVAHHRSHVGEYQDGPCETGDAGKSIQDVRSRRYILFLRHG